MTIIVMRPLRITNSGLVDYVDGDSDEGLRGGWKESWKGKLIFGVELIRNVVN